jgi:hypothetical protein
VAFHGNGADPDGPTLDNVMVEEIASPVPEPSPVVVASFSENRSSGSPPRSWTRRRRPCRSISSTGSSRSATDTPANMQLPPLRGTRAH